MDGDDPRQPAVAALDRLVAENEHPSDENVYALRANEWELLFQASRVSPVLHEAVVMLQAEFNRFETKLNDIATREWRDEGGRIAAAIARDALARDRFAALLEAERERLRDALSEPCAECGHIDWRADDFDSSPTAHQQGRGE